MADSGTSVPQTHSSAGRRSGAACSAPAFAAVLCSFLVLCLCKRVPASAKRKASQVFRPGVVPRQVELSWQAACRRTRKTALALREDLLLHEFVASAPDPSLPLIRPLATLVDCMSLYDSLCALGKRYARYEERTRIDKWKSKMDQS